MLCFGRLVLVLLNWAVNVRCKKRKSVFNFVFTGWIAKKVFKLTAEIFYIAESYLE